MKDSQGNIIYIGKSKSLYNRVKSYFNTDHKWNKINIMVSNIYDIDFIVTDTHLEAQLLECALIKKVKPIYNSQFKNDNKYVYLKIEDYNRYNSLSVVHNKDSAYCLGPYRNKNIIINLVDYLRNLYPIKSYPGLYKFTYKALPVTLDKNDFMENRESLKEIFFKKENMESFMLQIEKNMKEASHLVQFERASYYRDLLTCLRYLYNSNNTSLTNNKKFLMGEKLDHGYKLFFISDGRLVLKRKFAQVTRDNIEEFLYQAVRLENILKSYRNEKRDLDFIYIIDRELKVKDSKLIETVEEDFNSGSFLNKLLQL